MNDLYQRLIPVVQSGVVGSRLLCPDSIDSTNTEAKRQAAQGAEEGLVILSRSQSAGRGRAGRSFHSPAGLGLYLSALLRPKLPPEAVVNFTAWTAVAVCDAIEAACGVRPQIKWPNDLVLNGKKLCGILTELGLDQKTGALDYLVVGVGINVNHTPADFPEDIRSIATSLSMELGRPVDHAALAAQLIVALDRLYARFPEKKASYLEQYRTDCLTVGKQVQLITPTTVREAVATGIDEDFRLLVKYPDGTSEAVSTGEVSVRGMYGYV
jgi:BirA family biotin operon repressor/biotin-[acetyl-CoA-carboxylase] ligase